MSDIDNILRNLEEIYQDILYIRTEIENKKFVIPPKDREKIFEKHIELATGFGVLETTLNRVISTGY